MEAGLHIASFEWEGGGAALGATLGEVGLAAEEAGFATISLMDHFFQLEFMGPPELHMLEGYSGLSFLAGRTSTIELGLLVTGVTYRHPALLAKTVTTLDVLSGGRAKLGIGAAWFEREHVGLGVPFPPISERFERLEEALQICLQMWSDDNGPYVGRHYQLAETINSPQALSRPHPPILIGGSGERKTLRLVASYAQQCNLFNQGLDATRHKLDVLRGHCEAEGRDFDEIGLTMLYMGIPPTDAGGVDPFLKEMADYAALGFSTVYVLPIGKDPQAVVERFGADVIPRLAEL